MVDSPIKHAIDAAATYLRANPDEARYVDSPASATLMGGLLVRVTGPGGEHISTDMVVAVGGTASAPSPGWLLRAAEASCVATLIAMRAAMLGVELATLEVEVDSESDDRGILGLDDAIPAGPLSTRVVIRVSAADVPASALEDIARWGVAHCPVTDAVSRVVPLSIAVETRPAPVPGDPSVASNDPGAPPL